MFDLLFSRCPELAYSETRAARISGRGDLPDGNYGFLELFCTDRKCDCRRAIIHVVEERAPEEVLATISYGWEPPEFYERWYGSGDPPLKLAGARLEPLGRQSRLAPTLLELFHHLLGDPVYAARITAHYRAFRSKRSIGRGIKAG
jgi:hypothetical protein